MLFKLLRFIVFLSLFPSNIGYGNIKEINLQVQFNNYNFSSKSIKIYGFYGHEAYLIDSIKISSSNMSLKLKSESLYKGFYRLYISDQLLFDFITSPNEKLEFTIEKVDTTFRIIPKNKDNLLLYQLKKDVYELNYSIKLIQNIQSDDSMIFSNAQYSILELKIKKNELIEEYKSKFSSNTFKILSDFILEPIDEFGINSKNKFLDNLHLYDSTSIRTNVIGQKLIDYLAFYYSDSEEAFKKGIQDIFNACGTNEITKKYCLFYYLRLFNKVGPDQIFRFLVEEYYLKESCNINFGALDKDEMEGINKLINLMPGNKIVNFSIPDLNGKNIDNYKLKLKNNKILYVFWAPDCHYCEELLRNIQQEYKKIKKNNISIFSISITENNEDWKNKSNKFKWINTSDLKGWNSKIIKDLAVNKTPLLILTDSKGIILKYDFDYSLLTK